MRRLNTTWGPGLDPGTEKAVRADLTSLEFSVGVAGGHAPQPASPSAGHPVTVRGAGKGETATHSAVFATLLSTPSDCKMEREANGKRGRAAVQQKRPRPRVPCPGTRLLHPG